MRTRGQILVGIEIMFFALLCGAAGAASRTHVISFGKWTSATWLAEDNDKPIILRIRPMVIDGSVKEYVQGQPHDVTDRLFVARRVFRVNDSLTGDVSPRWQWQRGGWLLVDRTTGRVSLINLPDFDPFYSPAAWYRDYVAYCGVSDDGKSTFAIVAQIGRRKPVLKKALSSLGVADNGGPDSACATPSWQRAPSRVSFAMADGGKQTFAVRGHVVDVVNDADDESEGSK